MGTGCLRVIRNAALVAGAGAVLVTAVGLWRGWSTPRQFSDGLFWAGALFMALALLMIIGGQGVRASAGILYSESAAERISDRTRRWVAGLTEDYGTLLLLVVGGGILLALSVLVDVLRAP